MRNTRFLRCLPILTVLLLVVSLAPTVVSAQDGVTITYWRAGGVGTNEISEKHRTLLDEFEAANPDITVNMELVPFPEYDGRSLTSIQAAEGPDILEVNSVSLGLFTARGLVQPVDDLLEGSDIVEENFFPGAWAAGVYQDQVYGLPLDTGTRLIVYNKDLFDAAGLDHFGDTVTWEELLAAAEAINDPDNGVYGWGFIAGERWGNLYDGFGHFAIQNEAVFVTDDLTTATMDSDAMLETLDFYLELTSYGPPDAVSWNTLSQMESAFAGGTLGMYIAGYWSLDSALATNPDLNYGIAMPTRKVTASSTGGWIVSIPNHVEGDKREAVWRFMEFLFVPENNALWTDLMPNQPVALDLVLEDEHYDLYKAILPDSRHPIPLGPALPEMAEVLQVQIQSMILGDATTEETQASLQEEFQSLLDG